MDVKLSPVGYVGCVIREISSHSTIEACSIIASSTTAEVVVREEAFGLESHGLCTSSVDGFNNVACYYQLSTE
jgi:hypothetical protein